jgi:hypothetical protein
VKEYDGISGRDIIEAALLYAAQFGWNRVDCNCRVEPIQSPTIREGGISTSITLPITKWSVYLTPNAGPTVDVERLSGSLAGNNSRGHSRF